MNSDPRNVPSPDPYGSQPSWHGQQPPQGPGGQPPYPGAPQSPPPHGYPGQGQPGGPQQWGPQPQWAAGPPTPPNRGGKGKWILVGLALIAVIAVSIVGTVLALQPDSGGNDNQTPTANSTSDFASANDTGPANIITEDPTCEAWGRVARDYADQVEKVRWADRDPEIPATAWTPEQRAMYETVGNAMTEAAALARNLEKQTPHRVVRELYGQFITYSQAFVEAIPSYSRESQGLSNVVNGALSGVSNMCAAIEHKSVQSLAPLVAAPAAPTDTSPISAEPKKFLAADNSACAEWMTTGDRFVDATKPWIAIDAKIPATDWTGEQKAVYDQTAKLMTDRADEMERIGRASDNPVFEDIAVLAAQYMRAYVIAIPKYTEVDNYLSQASSYLAGTIYWACKASA